MAGSAYLTLTISKRGFDASRKLFVWRGVLIEIPINRDSPSSYSLLLIRFPFLLLAACPPKHIAQAGGFDL
jgi:hypothetical protein